MKSATDRVKRTEIRKVQGIDVEVRTVETFTYQGEWEPNGFEVFLGLKKIGHLYGWPTDSDLARLIREEIFS